MNIAYSKFLSIWKEYNSSDIKAKYKLSGRLTYSIAQAYEENNNDIEKINFYIKTLQLIKIRKNTRLMHEIILRKLDLMKMNNVEILKKKNFKILVESGCIEMGDLNIKILYNEMYSTNSKNLIKQIRLLNRYYLCTGGDGIFNIQVRVTNGYEPTISPKEYKLIIDTTETTFINIRSGIFVIEDIGGINDQVKNKKLLKIAPGLYKIAIFLIYKKKYLIILCKTEERIISNELIISIPTLEY